MTRILWVGCWLIGLLPAILSGAEIDVHDAFPVSEADSGRQLDGLALANGLSWKADGGILVLRKNQESYASFSHKGSLMARLPVGEGAKMIRVEARLHPVKLEESGNWLAVGIGNPKRATDGITWGGGVFMLVNTSGQVECFYNTGTKMARIKGVSPKNINQDDFNTLAIEYERSSNRVSMIVNGVPVIERFDLNVFSFVPDATWAGFSGFGQPPDQKNVMDFTLKVER